MSEGLPRGSTESLSFTGIGLPPERRGYVRGRVHNLRMSEMACQFGRLLVVEFDLWTGEATPEVPVRMSGTDFSGRVTEGLVLDIADPDPSVRPLVALRAANARMAEHEIVAQFPGRITSAWSKVPFAAIGIGVAVSAVLMAVLLVCYYIQ